MEAKRNSIDNVKIGSIIKEARLNVKMTQEQLAEAVDITPAFIGHIERGDRSLSLNTLVGIANTLNISMSYIFSNEEWSTDDNTINEFKQLMEDRPIKTKKAILAIIRTALEHLD